MMPVVILALREAIRLDFFRACRNIAADIQMKSYTATHRNVLHWCALTVRFESVWNVFLFFFFAHVV